MCTVGRARFRTRGGQANSSELLVQFARRGRAAFAFFFSLFSVRLTHPRLPPLPLWIVKGYNIIFWFSFFLRLLPL